MRTINYSAMLMAAGLLMAAPAFAQTSAQKQPAQEGGLSVATPSSNTGNPSYRQPAQEGGLSVGTTGASGNPTYRQPAQEGGLSVATPDSTGNPTYRQPAQEGGLSVATPGAPDPSYKQHTQNLTPSSTEAASQSK